MWEWMTSNSAARSATACSMIRWGAKWSRIVSSRRRARGEERRGSRYVNGRNRHLFPAAVAQNVAGVQPAPFGAIGDRQTGKGQTRKGKPLLPAQPPMPFPDSLREIQI